MKSLPVGKLPIDLLEELLNEFQIQDPRVLQGPGIGLDCAVIDMGDELLVVKSDPITFTSDEIGWYAVHVNANDIVTSGARPRWFMATLLMPENQTSPALVEAIFHQIHDACRSIGVDSIGGHSEITYELDRPIIAGTMMGTVERDVLILPSGACPGDCLLLTKGVPIEATSILAREFGEELAGLSEDEIARARNFIHEPGISVVKEALSAAGSSGVTGMHDPTEGGLFAALWEFARASEVGFEIDLTQVHIPELSERVCSTMGINPMEAISSGALLISVRRSDVDDVIKSIEDVGVRVDEIGYVVETPIVRMLEGDEITDILLPERDALAALFDE